PFYAFPATFQSGDTITLGITYFLDGNGKRAIIYYANGVQSPPEEFTNLEQGIIDNSTLGAYVQVVNDPTDSTNSGSRSSKISGLGRPIWTVTEFRIPWINAPIRLQGLLLMPTVAASTNWCLVPVQLPAALGEIMALTCPLSHTRQMPSWLKA